MKSKIDKNYKKLLITTFTLIIAAITSFSIFQGCMETVQPEDVNNRTLKAAVYRMVDEDSGELIPVRGAEIIVFDENEGNLTELKTVSTNENGIAVFELPVPLIGKLFSVMATYNDESQIYTTVLICSDTLINFIFSDELVTIDCGDLNIIDTLVFYDFEGSRRLKKNTPAGINKYERCKSITVRNSNPGPIEADIPKVNPPFELEGIYIDNNPVRLTGRKILIPPGSTLTICYSVNTGTAGIFNQTLPITLRCEDNSTGIFNLELQAEVVEPSCGCDDVKTSETILMEERVKVGETYIFSGIDVFVNNTACTVEILRVGADLADGWVITSPSFPVKLAKGEVLSISGEFKPTHSGISTGELNLLVKPQGTSNECPFDIYLEGEGCYNSCPFIGLESRLILEEFGTNSPYNDNISNRSDNKVFISAGGLISSAVKTYYIKNPDSACGETAITIDVSPEDNYADLYFSVMPSRLNLLPGETGQIDVVFTAPTLQELQQILLSRGPEPYTAEDSSFAIRLRIRGNNCEQLIDVNAQVTAFPDISPIINLRAYEQETIEKPVPENEVYLFGYASRSILKSADGSNGPYPPDLGDIWIDVNDNDQSAIPPQEPILKMVNTSIEVKKWKSNYPESKFSDVPALVTEFAGDPSYNIGYGPGPITGIAVNDVYSFKFDEMTYALIFIRRVDDGTEYTSSKQSGIEFRAVYPIYI
ncbi:hypothetical protein ACFLSQ_07775 [Bacteroidota bacterium]